MLHVCTFCEQVIEVPLLTEHLLVECAGRDKHPESKVPHSACPRCHLAVPASQLAAHVQAEACPDSSPPDGGFRCPMCVQDFVSHPDRDAWKIHLIDTGCPKNPRKPFKR